MKRLLVVDDDHDVLDSLKLLLETSYEICLAENGAQALIEMDRGFSPDAILLDLKMPILDGFGMMKELTRRGSTVPVLVVSAHPETDALARDLGARAAIRKPYTYEQLKQVLERILQGAAGGSSRPLNPRSIG